MLSGVLSKYLPVKATLDLQDPMREPSMRAHIPGYGHLVSVFSIRLMRNPQIPVSVFPLVVRMIWEPLPSLADLPHSLLGESSRLTVEDSKQM